MTYRENVELAAEAVNRGEDANWVLSRLTFESTRDRDGANGQGRVSMEQWADDVGDASGRRLSVAYLKDFKSAWRRYGGVPVHDRPLWLDVMREIHGTTREGQRDIDAVSMTRRASPDAKREVFQQLARDPDVIQDAAMLGTPTSKAVSDLYTRTERVREEFRERETEADPVAKRLDQVGAALDLEAACNRFARELVRLSEQFAREINDALPRTGPAREEHLYWVRQAIERARSVLNDLEGYAETGRTDLDAFLQEVLGGR